MKTVMRHSLNFTNIRISDPTFSEYPPHILWFFFVSELYKCRSYYSLVHTDSTCGEIQSLSDLPCYSCQAIVGQLRFGVGI